jgi:AbrB family looped-hinge helix DNA binding protein
MIEQSITSTVTSKMQVTIPSKIAKKVGVGVGEKVQFTERNGEIVITPVKGLVNELAGSLKIPAKWVGKDVETIIKSAKCEHFKSKGK